MPAQAVPMKKITRLLVTFAMASVFSVAMSGCATTQKVTTPIVSTVKDCADQVTHAVASGILDDVASILVCDAGSISALPGCAIAQLTAIAKTNGWPAVDCVLAELAQKAGVEASESSDPTAKLLADRANAALIWRSAGGTSAP